MIRVLIILALTACRPTVAELLDSGPAESDVDTDADGDVDVDTSPERLLWRGLLVAQADGCSVEMEEFGVDVAEDPEWAEALHAVHKCDMLYLVEAEPAVGCGISAPTLRGLKWRGNQVDIYSVTQSQGQWTAELLAEAERVDRWEFEYSFATQGAVAQGWAVLR